jgi:uncharacterized protein YdaU (DUF1376 family)
MAGFPYFKFYASDWLGSSKRAMMTKEQRAAYIDLLSHQWGDETCSLPDDDEVLAALSGLGEGWCKGGSEMLRRCFPKHPTLEGRIANPKLLEIRADAVAWSEKSAEGGRKSAQSKKLKATKGGSTTLPTKRQPNAKHPEPEPDKKKEPPIVPLDRLDFPDGMDTPKVRKAIGEWLNYKRHRRQTYKDPVLQIGKLLRADRFGGDPTVFVSAVNHSIANNYTGCYPEGTHGKSKQGSVGRPGLVD